MIGVNTNTSDPKKLKAIMEKEKMNWRSFGSRDVALKWNASTPGYYIIDHNGVIRHKWGGYSGPGEKAIDRALEKLIREAEEKGENCPSDDKQARVVNITKRILKVDILRSEKVECPRMSPFCPWFLLHIAI